MPTWEEASRAACELQIRLGTAGTLEDDATTSGGWSLAARLALDSGSAGPTTTLWALLPPDGAGVNFVVVEGDASEPWDWERVWAELDARRQAQVAAEAFVRAAKLADPVHRAERAESLRTFFREWDARHKAREAAERRGDAVLHLFDGQPVRVEGAVLLSTGGEQIETEISARRIDIGRTGPFAEAPIERPWEQQVWARPLGGGVWRRGRIQPEADHLVFVDEPTAVGPERGDGALRGEIRPRTLEGDVLASPGIRRKAADSAVYAQLLYVALENSTWRHADSTMFEGGHRNTAHLMASVVDASYLDWAWIGPTGVLDEEVLADLKALGWTRAP